MAYDNQRFEMIWRLLTMGDQERSIAESMSELSQKTVCPLLYTKDRTP